MVGGEQEGGRSLLRRAEAAGNAGEKLLGSLSGVLGGEVLVQDEDGDGWIDFFQRLARGFAMHGLHARGNYHQLCLGGLEQDAGVVDAESGEGVITGGAQHFTEERADVGGLENAKQAGPCVPGLSPRITRAEVGGGDRFLDRFVGFKLREQVGELKHFADVGRNSAEFEVASLGSRGLHEANQGAQAAAVDELYVVELQYDVAVLLDGVTDVGVQSKYFVARHDAAVALNDHDIADRAALQA